MFCDPLESGCVVLRVLQMFTLITSTSMAATFGCTVRIRLFLSSSRIGMSENVSSETDPKAVARTALLDVPVLEFLNLTETCVLPVRVGR